MHTNAVPPPLEKHRRGKLRWVGWIIVIIATLLLAGYFVVAAIVVARLTLPTRYALGPDPAHYGVPFEDVTFHSHGDDSITLSGWFMPNQPSTRAIIVVHGFGNGGCRTCGFNGRLGEFA